MKAAAFLSAILFSVSSLTLPAQIPVLKRSDVVFMYQAGRPVYEDYGVTVLAWGGKPTPQALEEARGIRFFGSVGMVTEFGRYHERFPQTYEQGLCRDVQGQPYKVPWLTDHQHKGVPYWWCCTRQPLFRQYISERVIETVKAGAEGVHIDDHLGTAGGLWLGGCFCDRCVAEFREYLKSRPETDPARQGVADPAHFDYRETVRAWLAEKPGRKVTQHPLWPHYRVYQLRGGASFMAELRALAAKTAGRPVPMSANAGLTWGSHLNDYQTLDFFSAEVEHHAAQRRFDDSPLVAYRLAEAVRRPLTSTASGQDWAFVKEQKLPGLVRGWIALGYAAGQSLMAPHRQWCYTSEKGTHWYEGPKEKFAPLYRFVRQHQDLFDDYQTHADVTVAFSHLTYDRNAGKIMGLCRKLAAANLSYRLALGGDEIVDHPLPEKEIRQANRLLVIEPNDFSPDDQRLLATVEAARRLESVEAALTNVTPAARILGQSPVRVLPRVKPGAAVVHLLNWAYDSASDGVQPLRDARVGVDLAALSLPKAARATLFAPGQPPRPLPMDSGRLTVPELDLWAVLEIRQPEQAR